MSVTILLRKSHEPAPLLKWAALVARARREDLLVLQPIEVPGDAKTTILGPADEKTDSPLAVAIREDLADDFVWRQPDDANEEANPNDEETDGKLQIWVKQLHCRDHARAVLDEVATSSVSILILPRHHAIDSSGPEFALELRLFRDAPCETMQLRIGEGQTSDCPSILVPSGGGHHTAAALTLATELAEASDGRVTALYVEPNVDDVAEQVGQQIVQRVVTRSLGSKNPRVTTKVVLSNDLYRGIAKARDESCDLLLLGVRYRGPVQRFLSSSTSQRLITSSTGPTVAIVRPAIPLASRAMRFVENTLKHGVPQLDRQRRVALVERVQSSSRWDFDFIALTCLSTLIATFGLMLDSAPVVIGAMLVAPLMTPLLGAGLSLVQGNGVLLRNVSGALLRGFLLAFAIALITGLLTPGLNLSNEMRARGSPGLLDLLVAFASGVAAAYAIGRPNLLSALPGVAIAAALVPPIATCGLGAALGRSDIMVGAALLFLTNIVAIVLGAACSLFAVGIRGSHDYGPLVRWTWRVSLASIVLLVGLIAYQSLPYAKLPQNVRSQLDSRLAQADAGVVSINIDRVQQPMQVDIVINAPTAPAESLASDLLEILEAHFERNIQLQLRSHLVTRARS